MTDKDTTTAVMDEELIQAVLRECDELDGAETSDGADLDDPRVPKTAMDAAEIPWHRLDHRAGYLLRHIDGQRSVAEIIAQSGIEARSARALLQDLLDQGCIKIP